MLEFASGVINVLEKKVFDKNDQERMLKSPTKDDAFSVLFDTDLAGLATEKNIEIILEKDLENLYHYLKKMLEPDIFSFLFLKFQALNLKAETKGKEKPFPFLREKMFLENDLKDSRAIEIAVDKAYFKRKLELAKKTKFLLETTKLEIDIANIKSLIKGKEFVSGGNLKEKELRDLIHLKEGEIRQDLKKFLEVFNLSLLMEKYVKGKSMIDLENGLLTFFSEKIFEKEKETGMGASKVLSFFQKKMNAGNNIKLILFSKENNINFKEIENNLLPL